MFFLIFLFTVLPVVELILLFKAGAAIGGLNTVAIVILTGVVGASMAKSQGLSLLQRIQSQMQQGQIPTDELLQGFLVFGGGLLLMTPGFVTDFFGFCMVMPGTRQIFARLVKSYFAGKVRSGQVHVFHSSFSRGAGSHGPNSWGEFSQDPFQTPRQSREIKDAKVIDVQDISDNDSKNS